LAWNWHHARRSKIISFPILRKMSN
jgi:hypothetical protein